MDEPGIAPDRFKVRQSKKDGTYVGASKSSHIGIGIGGGVRTFDSFEFKPKPPRSELSAVAVDKKVYRLVIHLAKSTKLVAEKSPAIAEKLQCEKMEDEKKPF